MSNLRQAVSRIDATGLGIPALVLLIMSMLVLPLPAWLLDILFTFNILISLIVIMVAIGITRPLEFSSFPAILLFTTMLRLALNVASTRVVLVEGHTGPDAAGQVIQAFGEFVIAGNYFVGIIVFAILIIINFMVITKGAGRVSEVSARFMLDAMPGKQMAIDADLNAGVLDQESAKKQREELSQEADLFGSMDGASKFVRGDAVAGLLILFINIIGGMIIGMVQHDLSLADASQTYVLLTIGDGLVAQIPALFLSLATAIVVTRVTTAESMTEQTKSQLSSPSALFISGGILAILGLVPGMPTFVFLSLAAIAASLGLIVLKKRFEDEEATARGDAPGQAGAPGSSDDPANPNKELDWDDLDTVDVIGLEIGYGLIPLVNAETGGQLMTRVKGVRKKLSAELGYLIQPVRIRDSLTLDPDHYTIIINGVVRGKGEAKVGRELAISPGQVYGTLEGIPTKEPAFGLDAVWIDPSQRDYARTLGYTVVDAATAIATHLNKVLRDSASELLSRDETQQLLDKLASKFPKLVEDVVPAKLPLGVVTKVLQTLLEEGVSIRDMRSIMEALSDACSKTQDPTELTGLVRPRIGRMIIQTLLENQETLPVMTLDPALEQMLHNVLQQHRGDLANVVLEPGLAEGLFRALRNSTKNVEEAGNNAVLVVSPVLRPWLSRAARHRVEGLTVLSYAEIPDDQSVKVIETVEIREKAE
ncbi:MAG: flagellar biosynthesis protein FlhA [Burkholderiaceae bacterium]